MSNRDRENLGQNASPQQPEEDASAHDGDGPREAVEAAFPELRAQRDEKQDQAEEEGAGAEPKQQGAKPLEHRVASSFMVSLVGLIIVAAPLSVHGVVMFIGVYALMFVGAKAYLGWEERRHGRSHERGDGVDPPFVELRLSVTVIGILTIVTLIGLNPETRANAVYLVWPLALGLFCGAADGIVARSLPYGALAGVIWRGGCAVNKGRRRRQRSAAAVNSPKPGRWRLAGLLVIGILAIAPAAWATMAVVDAPAIAKLTKQLTEMQKQLDVMTEMSKRLQGQIDAVGRAGRVTVALPNAARLGGALRRDLRCLAPDLSRLMPNVEFEDAEWLSVCEAAPGYRQTLWLDPKDVAELETWEAREAATRGVQRRRENVLVDAASKGLAHADMAGHQVDDALSASDELETAAAAATTSNERLAVIAESQAVLVRAMAQQTQLLAQLLRVQSAYVMGSITVRSTFGGEEDAAAQPPQEVTP